MISQQLPHSRSYLHRSAGRLQALERPHLTLPAVSKKYRSLRMQSGQGDAPAPFKPSKPTLIDIPVSNNGARCRFVIYKEGLEEQIDIAPPGALGGLKSEQFLAYNRQGKFPILILPGSDAQAIAESEVIALYLLEKYTPDSKLLPSTPEDRARARQAARVMDVYITPIQGCMYRALNIKLRSEQIQELARQLDVLESSITGPFVLGQQISHADGALFPTLTWMNNILPRIFGWKSVFTGRPKLQQLFEAMRADPHAKRVMQELEEALEVWHSKDRWGEAGIKEHVADTSYSWAQP